MSKIQIYIEMKIYTKKIILSVSKSSLWLVISMLQLNLMTDILFEGVAWTYSTIWYTNLSVQKQ